MDLYHGGLRAARLDYRAGKTIFDHVDYNHYWEQIIAEEVKSWTYMKFPFLRVARRRNEGWYRVGPAGPGDDVRFHSRLRWPKRNVEQFLAFDAGSAAGARRSATTGRA
jgi:NAD-reducing hydrogenase large subunit